MADQTSLRKTPLLPFHQAAGAKLIDFGGWLMPLQYTKLLEEHARVRSSVGLFDVSHMGEIRIRGDRAHEVVANLVSNDVDIVDGQAQYTCMCNEDGGVVDDLIVYRLSFQDFLLCVNVSNQEKDFQWAKSHNIHAETVSVVDESGVWAQIAIQGRNAQATLQQVTSLQLESIGFFKFAQAQVAGVDGCIVARTGYTGEDGFEVFIPASRATEVWPALLTAGEEFDICPVGLGARDTLRLEARLMLYGNDMNETISPFEASLGWCTKLSKPEFVGRDALIEQRQAGLTRRLVGMTVEGRIPRPHCPILADGEVVGEVTSGTRSPSLGIGVAMGYVPPRLARPSTSLQIDVRGRLAEATVIRGPFYKRDY